MSFSLAAVVVVALAVVALGLSCYHLLSRLDAMERAVLGGMQAPTRRLTRHEFEQRFARAHERRRLADRIGDGLVLAVGAEYPDGELARTLEHLPRADGVYLMPTHDDALRHIERQQLPGIELVEPWPELGVTLTPHVFVIDDERIRHSQPVTSTEELLDLLRIST